MKIVEGKPVSARREFICNGDEARVSRILTGPYEGLVERLQTDVPKEFLKTFDIKHGANIFYSAKYYHPLYHAMKFLSHLYAKKVLPDHFPFFHELRVYHGKKTVYSSYSDFVPDQTDTLVRKAVARKRYYKENDPSIRLESDEIENILHPELKEAIGKLVQAGIVIHHPEANFHFNGNIVFFDIDGLFLDQARKTNNREALSILSMIPSIILKGKMDVEFEKLVKFFQSYLQINSDYLELKNLSEYIEMIGGDLDDLSSLYLRAPKLPNIVEINCPDLFNKH